MRCRQASIGLVRVGPPHYTAHVHVSGCRRGGAGGEGRRGYAEGWRGGGCSVSLRLILWVAGDGVIARESCLVAAPLNEGDGIGSDADSVSPVSLLLV